VVPAKLCPCLPERGFRRTRNDNYNPDESDGYGRAYYAEFSYDFLATIFGLNVERETFQHADKKLTLSLRAEWECQIKYAAITSIYDSGGVPSIKNATVVVFRASQKLNDHRDIIGSYSAGFNKDLSSHNLACGVEYAF
jgi:hypothetical protein